MRRNLTGSNWNSQSHFLNWGRGEQEIWKRMDSIRAYAECDKHTTFSVFTRQSAASYVTLQTRPNTLCDQRHRSKQALTTIDTSGSVAK
jgi:hypothetical protein